jgi:hypothetical protein
VNRLGAVQLPPTRRLNASSSRSRISLTQNTHLTGTGRIEPDHLPSADQPAGYLDRLIPFAAHNREPDLIIACAGLSVKTRTPRLRLRSRNSSSWSVQASGARTSLPVRVSVAVPNRNRQIADSSPPSRT